MKITLRPDPQHFEETAKFWSRARNFFADFFKSIGLDNLAVGEQPAEFELVSESPEFEFDEMRIPIPNELRGATEWKFRFAIMSPGISVFSINGLSLYAIVKPNTSLEHISRLPGDLLSLRWSDRKIESLDVIGRLGELRAVNLGWCESLQDIRALSQMPGLMMAHLKGCGSLQDLTPLATCGQLTSLDLDRCKSVSDIGALAGLRELTHLDLWNCSLLSDVSPLQNLKNLTSLNLGGCSRLDDASFLSELTELRKLSLSRWKGLTDLHPLSHLQRLTELDLSWCPAIADLTPLSCLIELRKLELSGCEGIREIDPIATLKQLEELHIRTCEELQNAAPLSGLTELRYLDLSDWRNLRDIGPLSELRKLETLNLNGCTRVLDLSPLSSLHHLVWLSIHGVGGGDIMITHSGSTPRGIPDLEPLAHLSKLQTLHLSSMPELVDLSPLAQLKSLAELNLSGCDSLTDLNPITGLSNLEKLDLGSCYAIKDFGPIAALTKLTRLKIQRCADLSPLRRLIRLEELRILSGDEITDLEPLSGLNRLEWLSLFDCEKLEDISPLGELSRLRNLSISGNAPLFDLAPLAGLEKLQSVKLDGLSRIQGIQPLRACPNLSAIEVDLHPVEIADLLAFTAASRGDRKTIFDHAGKWLGELERSIRENYEASERFAITLGDAFGILGPLPNLIISIDDAFTSYFPMTKAPWLAWLQRLRERWDFEGFQKAAVQHQPVKLPSGAIGAICSVIGEYAPRSDESEERKWALSWLSELEERCADKAVSIRSAAPEICLANERLGQRDAVGRWLVRFTDPADATSLDSVHETLARWHMAGGRLQQAESHVSVIGAGSVGDALIVELAKAHAADSPDESGRLLLMIETPEKRSALALHLASSKAFTSMGENQHRLLVGVGDSPEKLASLLEILGAQHPESAVLEEFSRRLTPHPENLKEWRRSQLKRFLEELS